MNHELAAVKAALNQATGQTAASNLLLMALISQVTDKAKLLEDFEEMAEDTTVRAMFGSMPEAFFQQLQASVATWKEAIQMK